MDSIVELIKSIRQKPELYVGKQSLSLIQAYIYGWVNRDEENIVDSEYLGEFQDWIQAKYNITSTQSWASIILFFSIDERDALNRFFLLFDEFLNERKK